MSPDGRTVATGSADGTIRLYDVATQDQVGAPLPALPNRPVAPLFTPDGNYLFAITSTGQAYRWDVRPSAWAQRACAIAGRTLTRIFSVKDFTEAGVHSLSYERATLAVREAARAAGDRFTEGRTQAMLAHLHIIAGNFDQADAEAEQAIAAASATGDLLANCYSLNDRGIIANCQSRYADGESYLTRAVEAFRADGNAPSEASALCNLAQIQIALGRMDSAIDLARRDSEIYQDLDHTLRVANGRYVLGRVLTHAGHIAEALAQLSEAAELFRETRQPLWEGVSHYRIAEAHLMAGRPGKAAGHAEQALALRGIGGEWMRGRMLTVLGKALDALEQRGRARVCWQDALGIFEEMGSSDADEVRSLLLPAVAG